MITTENVLSLALFGIFSKRSRIQTVHAGLLIGSGKQRAPERQHYSANELRSLLHVL